MGTGTFLFILTIVLLVLKATGYLAISWLVVFLPLIIGLIFGVVALGIWALFVHAFFK